MRGSLLNIVDRATVRSGGASIGMGAISGEPTHATVVVTNSFQPYPDDGVPQWEVQSSLT